MKTNKLTDIQKDTLDVLKNFKEWKIEPKIADIAAEIGIGWSSARDRVNSLIKIKLAVRNKKTKKVSLK